ncbi:hypothetical protein PG993_006643 [Apiospora rasikravindrae]|uniref:DUF7605 domain-containing protein n=1 Tax=Apiospora rasikravindrae TaxID=990691 RepID=A0ABR1T694_9PEZI
MADSTTPTTGIAQDGAIPEHGSRSEAASGHTSTELLSDTHPKRGRKRSTEDNTEVIVKDEPESSQSYTMRLPSETVVPIKDNACDYARKAFAEHTTESLVPLSGLAKESLKKLMDPLKKFPNASDSKRALQTIKDILKRGTRPDETYRAEVEFATAEEWRKEMEDLIEDLKHSASGDGDSSQDGSENTEAQISWAKIQSVYPCLDKDTLIRSGTSNLLCNETIQSILGATKVFKADSARELFGQIQQYMDSSVDLTEKETTENEQPAALWPLTKVVRVFTKADVLSTGLTLVDLPGCGDSNAARGSVAAKYMEQCTSIFIVAPILRAVDDKVAQHLLGESFKLQMKLDGHYANMTFVCSRTDGLHMDEQMASRLGLGKAFANWEENVKNKDATIASEKAERQKLEDDISAKKAQKKRLEKSIAQYQKLMVQAVEGKPVVAPAPNSKKRKSTSEHNQPTKKQRGASEARPEPVDSGSDSDDDDDESAEDGVEIHGNGTQKTLTFEDICSTLSELGKEKNIVSKDVKDKNKRLDELRDHEVSLEKDVEEQKANLKSECIKRRNEKSRSAIKQDFIRGRKELDQKTAARGRGFGHAKKKVVQDHETIGERLSVYCVSALQYQKKCGRATTVDEDAGFVTAEDTEIPQLLDHTKKSAEAGSIENYKRFWATPKDNEDILSEEDVRAEEENLTQDIENLTTSLNKIVTDSTGECKNIMKRNLFNQFKPAVAQAAKQLRPITQKWVTEKAADGRYIYPSGTYKAILRREGKYRRNGRDINFNEELATPLKEIMADAWELTFQQQIPEVLDKFSDDIRWSIMTFHDTLNGRFEGTAVATRVNLLEDQLRNFHIQGIQDQLEVYRSEIGNKQREATRMFTSMVLEEMRTAYDKCKKQKGRGAIDKMRKVVETQVVRQGKKMLNAVAAKVEEDLTEITNNHTEGMLNMVKRTLSSMDSDYRARITQRDDPVVSSEDRYKILRIISEIDDDFRQEFISESESDTPEGTAAMDIDDSPNADPYSAPAHDEMLVATE